MIIVGLTGGIASGKSTVSRIIREHGIPLIDLDEIARTVVQKNSPTLKRLVIEFGPTILEADGTLNRAALGRIAFGNKESTRALNRITHSAIRRVMAWRLLCLWLTGCKRVVVDTPLLIEAGLYKWCAEVVIVWCDETQQHKRMLLRDQAKGLTMDDAKARLNAQMPLTKKIPYADVVIDNSIDATESSPPRLRAEVARVISRWRRESRQPMHVLLWLLCWLVPPVGLLWGLFVTWLRARKQAKRT